MWHFFNTYQSFPRPWVKGRAIKGLFGWTPSVHNCVVGGHLAWQTKCVGTSDYLCICCANIRMAAFDASYSLFRLLQPSWCFSVWLLAAVRLHVESPRSLLRLRSEGRVNIQFEWLYRKAQNRVEQTQWIRNEHMSGQCRLLLILLSLFCLICSFGMSQQRPYCCAAYRCAVSTVSNWCVPRYCTSWDLQVRLRTFGPS